MIEMHPSDARAHIQSTPPDLGVALPLFVERSAERYPDRIALAFDDHELTYGVLQDRITRLAVSLAALGVGHGDHVAVLMHNRPEYAEATFACLTLGAVVVPVNFRLGQTELDYILEHSGAIGIVSEGRLAGRTSQAMTALPGLRFHIETPDGDSAGTLDYEQLIKDGSGAPPDVDDFDSKDTAFIMYTSGTTGRPKGAMLSHDNLVWQSHNMSLDLTLTPGDVYLSGSPLFHVAGMAGMMPYLALGARIVVPTSSGFSAPEMIALLRRHRVTICFFVPTQWAAICRMGEIEEVAKVLRVAIWGASPASRPLLELMDRTLIGVDVVTSFGQTEMSPTTVRLRDFNSLRKLGSVGRPTTNVEVRVVDDAGQDVATGEVGEIIYRGPTTMKGYYNDETATAEAFAGGWFHSGDLVTADEEGFLYVVDRKKDMIISGGENIYPAEVEAVLFQHEAVADVSVVGVPHERWVETPVAVVVAEAGASVDEADLIEHARLHLAGYKCPTAVTFIDELPRNAGGKILKRVLRQQLDESAATTYRSSHG